MRRGLFVVFEGIDGSGTTTQARVLVSRLCREGYPAMLTREPSSGTIGSLIDRLITVGNQKLDSSLHYHDMIALLFAADRLQHLDSEVLPALREGRVVVSGRYVMSSWAYQSVRLPEEWVNEINGRSPKADLTILLDVMPRVGLQRVYARKGKRQVFEREQYLKQVRINYLKRARRAKDEAGRVVILDGSGIIAEVRQAVWEQVQPLVAQRCGTKNRPKSEA
jgi:dTMP kinase